MGFFDNFGRSVQATSRTTIQKTKELADIARLNNQIAENNSKITQLYIEIGNKYCQLHSSDAEPQLANIVNAVIEMKAQINEWNDQIQNLRGMAKCPHCGKVIPKNTIFCSGCGQRLIADDVTVCVGCGEVVPKGILFCTKCGTRIPDEGNPAVSVPEAKCKECGAVLETNAVFCPCCGMKVTDKPLQSTDTHYQEVPNDIITPGEQPYGDTEQNEEETVLPLCKNCGQPLEEGYDFCTNCGKPVENSNNVSIGTIAAEAIASCPSCGNEIAPNEMFCSNCGYKIP